VVGRLSVDAGEYARVGPLWINFGWSCHKTIDLFDWSGDTSK